MFLNILIRKTKDYIYAYTNISNLKIKDEVLVETEHGIEIGLVQSIDKIKKLNIQKNKKNMSKILRKLTKNDRKKIISNNIKNIKVKSLIIKKITNDNLCMKLICVSYTFDCSKLFVYYTAETRVDFRKFVKELGYLLKTRIQMVQVGIRDEAKIIGGIGICGKILCCQSFLKSFDSITINMAKRQGLSLNTTKLSGCCGRLKCCISFEKKI
ncbi:MAG: hypothetical protein LBL53_00445 [Endomicrobium sp.]|jgi:cell fate regulator YaaT (PSP1 superfamily)|nr:hypothetical protein [Endomicrobium sp.]